LLKINEIFRDHNLAMPTANTPWKTYALSIVVFYEVFAYMADLPSMAKITFNYARTSQLQAIEFVSPAAQSEIPRGPLKGTGTAVMITNDGFFATNRHVVKGCDQLLISTGNTRIKPVIVKQSRTYDLAILKIDLKNPARTKRMKLKSPELGEKVLVYGYPFSKILSKEGNLTTGIVSALDGGTYSPHLFQLTAPIQSGNSGSGVLNERGELLGIVVSKFGSIKVAEHLGDIPQNVNFAISSDFVKTTFQQFKNYDEPAGVLGQYISRPTDSLKMLVESSVLVECY
jgi:S1-C subfamily serine protease